MMSEYRAVLAFSGFQFGEPSKLHSCLMVVNCEMRGSYSVMCKQCIPLKACASAILLRSSSLLRALKFSSVERSVKMQMLARAVRAAPPRQVLSEVSPANSRLAHLVCSLLIKGRRYQRKPEPDAVRACGHSFAQAQRLFCAWAGLNAHDRRNQMALENAKKVDSP